MNSSSLPRRYDATVQQQPQHQTNSKGNSNSSSNNNLLVRLIRHFSSHSIASSSPTHSYERFGSSLDRRSERKPSRPNLQQQQQQSTASSNGSNGVISSSIASNNGISTSNATSGTSNGGIPSSVSNGEIGSSHGSGNSVAALSIPICALKNHGNTCFMNAIVQCLSNTDLLAEYFVMGHYRTDMHRHNKLHASHAKKYGTRGEVTDQLALLLKSLWSNQYSPEISNKFKQLVSKHGSQYEGSDQHDAQEFLLWLLDKVHEDVNVASKRKYKKSKTSSGPHLNISDEILASETLANHMRCNSSFIHELFQAQLRSSLVCRSCGKRSNTFDPYLCLSLPVPTRQTHTIVVNVTYLHKLPKEVKIAVSIESQATLRELRDKVSRLIKVPEKQLILLRSDADNGLKELSRDMEIIQELLDDMQEIYGVETPPTMQGSLAAASSLGRRSSGSSSSAGNSSSASGNNSQMLIIVWRNGVGNGGNCSLFGSFFTSHIPRESSFKQIQTEMMSSMKAIVRKGVDGNIINDSVLFALRVVGGYAGKSYLPDDVEHPLYMPCVDRALQTCEERDYRGPVHLKLVVEWDSDVRHSLLLADNELPLPAVDSNIEYVKARTQKANRASLQDCFDLYFREEKLASDNAWLCPACKRRQQCIKQLSLWSVPDVFIIHLKRFRQLSNAQRSKLSTLVLFPLSGLDMNSYLVPRKQQTSQHRNNGSASLPRTSTPSNGSVGRGGGALLRNSSVHGSTSPPGSVNTLPAIWSPWQKPRLKKQPSRSEDSNIYDLYAVCNHHGNMQGGHYTAYCKNPVDGRWFSFDDTKVGPLSEASVITADAYILFYQRSCLSSAASCASSSTSGYSSSASSFYSGDTAHWASRMPQPPPSIHHRISSSPKSSRSQDNLISEQRNSSPPKINGTSASEDAKNGKSDRLSRSNKAYASLPTKSERISDYGPRDPKAATKEKATKAEAKSRSSSTPPTNNNSLSLAKSTNCVQKTSTNRKSSEPSALSAASRSSSPSLSSSPTAEAGEPKSPLATGGMSVSSTSSSISQQVSQESRSSNNTDSLTTKYYTVTAV